MKFNSSLKEGVMNGNISEQVIAHGELDLRDACLGLEMIPMDIREKIGDPQKFQAPEVLDFLTRNSKIANILHHNPANDAMLQIVYYDKPSKSAMKQTFGVDRLLSRSLSGQALRDRLVVCGEWIAKNFVKPHGQIVDLGGGSSSYLFEALRTMEKLPEGFLWKTLDFDGDSLQVANQNAVLAGVEDHLETFAENFMSQKSFPTPKDQADFAVLIGVLCGMDKDTATRCLQKCKSHIKDGGQILAATLLDSSFTEDPLTFRLLCNVGGWQLRPKPMSDVKEVFDSAGWRIESVTSERRDEQGKEIPGQYAIVHATAL